ncbi:MAG: hypothetical protein NTX52_02755 [Planctomycetota bacterium]|nr:hypothetical protein [Planctomycetota bacterium]
MSQTETQDILSETEVGASDGDNLKFVPVAESIRYRKRAQSAEKKVEALAEELSEAKTQTAKMSEQIRNVQIEQKLMRKLAAAGALDLEAAVLVARARMEDEPEANPDSVIEQLKKEKQYLFAGASGAVIAKKTAGAKERVANSQTVLDAAAKRAATTGNRADLQKYLRLRRNFL